MHRATPIRGNEEERREEDNGSWRRKGVSEWDNGNEGERGEMIVQGENAIKNKDKDLNWGP